MESFTSPTSNVSVKTAEGLMPKEEKLEVAKRKQELSIGVPAETHPDENRTPLTPLAVDLIINNGHSVKIESNSGKGANFSDKEYSEAGAQITHSREEIFKCDIILKVSPFTQEEINMMPGKQTALSILQAKNRDQQFIRSMMQKRNTAIAFEFIKDHYGQYPIVRSMSEISGTTSILIAAEYLSNAHNGKGEMLGGIPGITPTEVVVIGSGTAAEYAVRTALGLGARVMVFDTCIHKLRRLQQTIGQHLFTSVLQPRVLAKALKTADVAIGAMQMIDRMNSFIVTEEMVINMKNNSVIIDISIDHGGCFETSRLTSHSDPVFIEHGVVHYCVPNIASRVARTASYAISNIISSTIVDIGNAGGVNNLIKESVGIRNGVYLYNGILTNKYVGDLFDIPAKDINLLLAAF